jgi:AcrR family transcriptional regulator
MNIHSEMSRPAKISTLSSRSDKREAIFDAALELFAERGFHGTAVPDVAVRAGVGTGTLYRYFESKEALVNALYQRWKGALMGALVSQVELDGTPREQFRVFWHGLGQFAVDNPLAIAFLELHHHAPYLNAESRRIEKHGLDMLRAFVVRGQAAHVLRKVAPEVLMAVVYGAFVGMLKGSLAGYLPMTPKALGVAEGLLWEAIRA